MTRTILQPADVAEMTGRGPETLKFWRANGGGPRWFKLGRRVVYSLDDVQAWIDEQRQTTGSGAA